MQGQGFAAKSRHALITLRIPGYEPLTRGHIHSGCLTMHASHDSQKSRQEVARRERLLKVLSAATFLIFFQAYMVAPLIPRLSAVFGISAQQIGLIVPAYLIPYGVSTLVYGVLSDRLRRRPLMFAPLGAFILPKGPPATANTPRQMTFRRAMTLPGRHRG